MKPAMPLEALKHFTLLALVFANWQMQLMLIFFLVDSPFFCTSHFLCHFVVLVSSFFSLSLLLSSFSHFNQFVSHFSKIYKSLMYTLCVGEFVCYTVTTTNEFIRFCFSCCWRITHYLVWLQVLFTSFAYNLSVGRWIQWKKKQQQQHHHYTMLMLYANVVGLCHCRCCYFYCSLFSLISNFISILMLYHFQWKCSIVMDGSSLVRKLFPFYNTLTHFERSTEIKMCLDFDVLLQNRALTSGTGVALALLIGAAGPLIGVAISASLLPPVVNCVSINIFETEFWSISKNETQNVCLPSQNHINSVEIATNLAYNFILHAQMLLFTEIRSENENWCHFCVHKLTNFLGNVNIVTNIIDVVSCKSTTFRYWHYYILMNPFAAQF